MKMHSYRLQLILFFSCVFLLSSCKKLLPTAIFPYSMVKVDENLFIDQTEITVEQYAEFVFDGNEDHMPKKEFIQEYKHYPLFYPTSEPDSLFRAFGKIDYYDLPVMHEYFDTLKYKELRQILDFPITGISYEDALAYCEWRTEKYALQGTDHTKKEISFHLPNSSFYQSNDSEVSRNAIVIALVYNTAQNEKGIYGLNSNVAEITASGKIFGAQQLFDWKFDSELEDTPPHIHTGFRCVGRVKE